MDIEFRWDVQYPFKTLKIENDQKALFILSLILVFLFQILGQFITKFKIVNITRKTVFWQQIVLHFVIYSYKALAMLILMCCNGWVIITLLLGQFSGYMLFSSKYFRSECPGNLDNKVCC